MTLAHRLYVGTIGEGLFRSVDGGVTFHRSCGIKSDSSMFVECHVRAFAIHPREPAVLYLGSEQGLFVSRDGAENWTRLDAPLAGLQVWSLWVSPQRPELLVAGTCPSRLFRSDDGGKTWTEPATTMRKDCPRIMWTRVTSLLGDPANPDQLWAGVEIDGVHHSRDGGRSWQPLGTGLSSQDIHALVIVPNGRGRRMLAATNNDLNVSTDDGATWRPLEIGKSLPWSYCRGMGQKAGSPEVVFLGNGDGPPGTVGVVARSTDGGATWQAAKMPGRANSTLWNFATHAADPELIYAASVSGEVYRSTDGGEAWEKLEREFGEVRALAWAPLD
jgi:photosystem II stability/assembly factor-like uncharacterized protein